MMHETPTSYRSTRDRFPRIGNRHLSAIEECFFIGGSTRIGGEMVNTGELKKSQPETDHKKPKSLLSGEEDVIAVNDERSKGYIRGFLPFFDYEGEKALADEGLEVALKTSPVDPNLGVAPTEWEVIVIPLTLEDEIVDDGLLHELLDQNRDKINIHEDNKSMFALENTDFGLMLRMI